MRRILLALPLLLALTACIDIEEQPNTPQGNFEALWKIIDERYCFLTEKGIDWNAIHSKYAPRIDTRMTEVQLFEVLTDMLAELKDGHVNLSSTADFGRYWKWKENYPANLSDTLIRRYLGTDYRIASMLSYRILDDNIAYVRLPTFNQAVGDGQLDALISHCLLCRAMIIDIRDNGGGMLTMSEKIAARFLSQRTLVGYNRHKQGPGHDDFSKPRERWIETSSRLRWTKPVCLLTNRAVYSAANDFTMIMRQLPHVTVIGDHTGGGGGTPFNSSLPNGWAVRFSACPSYDAEMKSIEYGIDPDIRQDIGNDPAQDAIIERAREIINNPKTE